MVTLVDKDLLTICNHQIKNRGEKCKKFIGVEFLLFKAVEVQTILFLPAYLGKSLQSADIKQLVDKNFADKDVQYYWSMVAVDIESEEDYCKCWWKGG